MNKRNSIISIFVLTLSFVFAGCTATNTNSNENVNTKTNLTESTTKVTQHDDTVIFVNDDATGTNDGSTWENAFNDLQDAITYSQEGDQIWVAEGTYYAAESDETVSFSLVDGTDLYGGFEGTETSVDQRNITEHDTILSGDIDKDGTTDGNTNNILLATNGVIDGFIIQDGYSETNKKLMPNSAQNSNTLDPDLFSKMPSRDNQQSGQMGPPPMNSGSQGNNNMTKPSGPMSDNTENSSAQNVGHSSPSMVTSGDAESTPNGAGIVVWGVSATIKNTTIQDCYAGKGGAVYVNVTNELDTQPLFYNVIIKNNSSSGRGGGVSIDMKSNPVFIDCLFIDNYCGGKGGAMYNDFGCSSSLYNCLFVNNESEMAGGIGNDGVSNSILYNCTFTGNVSSEQGAAIYQGTGPFNDPIIINSVVSGNTSDNGQSEIFNWNESNTAVFNSVVEGGYNGLSEGLINDTATFDNSYNCTNFELGFDSTEAGNRTQEEIAEIIETLNSVENTAEPTILDVSNKSTKISSSSIIYVDMNGTGNGSSKNNATSDLQEAIYEANNYYNATGKTVTIYLANGVYTPGENRSDSFILQSGVKIIGKSEENTILSGEIGSSSKEDNSYHVVIGSDDSSLNDLTIRDGYADGKDGEVYDRLGGGLLNYAAGNRVIPTYEPTLGFDTELNNVTFVDNFAECGAASYTYHGGNPSFTECTFLNNNALYGGATMEVGGCAAVYENCDFENNYAMYSGGASFVDYGSLTSFIDCNFISNIAENCGGAIYEIDRASQSILNDTSFSTLIDSSWSNDKDIFSSAYLEDCSFTNNTAKNGNSIYLFEGSYVKLDNTYVNQSDIEINLDGHLIETLN
jgi:hypothetical protein